MSEHGPPFSYIVVNLAALVTPIAVFQRRDGRLALESWHPDSSLDEVIKRTGFEFDAAGAQPTPIVTPRERDALAGLDPDGAFEAEAAIRRNGRNSVC